MSQLETMFAQFTVAELASKAGISLTTLLERIGFGATGTRDPTLRRSTARILEHYDDDLSPLISGAKERLASSHLTKDRSRKTKQLPIAMATAVAKAKAPGKPALKFLVDMSERESFDNTIMDVLRASGSPLKASEIRVALPWTTTRDQLSRAMVRLRDAKQITFTGNTQARVYAPVRKPKN